ncbi:MAG: hypothetical protein ACK4GD_00510 [Sphingomonadaceae bacterium]
MREDKDRSNGLTEAIGNRPLIVGIVLLASFIMPVMVVVGVVLAYVFRRDPAEDWEVSHYQYLVRTFWIACAIAAVFGLIGLGLINSTEDESGLSGIIMLLGLLGAGVVTVFFAVRVVMSIIRANARQAMPHPTTLLF